MGQGAVWNDPKFLTLVTRWFLMQKEIGGGGALRRMIKEVHIRHAEWRSLQHIQVERPRRSLCRFGAHGRGLDDDRKLRLQEVIEVMGWNRLLWASSW